MNSIICVYFSLARYLLTSLALNVPLLLRHHHDQPRQGVLLAGVPRGVGGGERDGARAGGERDGGPAPGDAEAEGGAPFALQGVGASTGSVQKYWQKYQSNKWLKVCEASLLKRSYWERNREKTQMKPRTKEQICCFLLKFECSGAIFRP